MALDVITPDARKKVDELFLYWLSEPSTQELLRHELAKVCGLHQPLDLLSPAFNLKPRPTSPTIRSVTPPPAPQNSPLTRSSPRSLRNSNLENNSRNLAQVPEVDTYAEESEEVLGTPVKTLAESSVKQSSPLLSQVNSRVPPIVIPRFYFPRGKPDDNSEELVRTQIEKAEALFSRYPNAEIPWKKFDIIVKLLDLPLYWKAPLFKTCSGKNRRVVTFAQFKKTWLKLSAQCHDDASKMVTMLSGHNKNYLVEEDFHILVQDIVDTHPGLEFLRAAPEFHNRYIETVIRRIFYYVDKTWRGRITAQDIRNSTLLQTIAQLEHEDDINKIPDFFSYEHFYVIYCKFWELDTDHDLLIDAQDLARHCDHALSSRVIERILSGSVTRDSTTAPGKMSYKDFVWFLISEEDKTTSRSIEYWFRVLDKDGDGVLSLYELEYFYEEILDKLDEMNIESLSIENTICQALDMINPRESCRITLKDLKANKLTPIFLNTFVNIEKYLDFEQKEPVNTSKDEECDGDDMSQWERYASEQYEILISEEQCDDDEIEEEEELVDNDSDGKILSTLKTV